MLILKGRFSVESQDPGEEHCGAGGEEDPEEGQLRYYDAQHRRAVQNRNDLAV